MVQTTFAGRDHIASFVAIDGVPGKWYVGVAVDSDMAYASLNKLRITAIVATLAATVLMLLALGLVLKRVVATPIAAQVNRYAVVTFPISALRRRRAAPAATSARARPPRRASSRRS